MALTAKQKAILDIAMASKAAANALIAKLDANEELSARELRELEIAMGDKKAAAEIAHDAPASADIEDQDAVDSAQSDVDDAQDVADDAQADVDLAETNLDVAQDAFDNYVAPVAADATLDLTADIILTSVAEGAARNGNTFTLQVLPAAANPTDTVLVDFTGTAAAIICTVTPNDGTNNTATPVDLTTAELVELINTGAVVGKTITIGDTGSERILQTATGGDTTALADAGEGDGEIATFANGVTEVGDLAALTAALAAAQSDLDDAEDALALAEAALAAAQAILDAALGTQLDDQVSSRSLAVMTIAMADKDTAEALKEEIEK